MHERTDQSHAAEDRPSPRLAWPQKLPDHPQHCCWHEAKDHTSHYAKKLHCRTIPAGALEVPVEPPAQMLNLVWQVLAGVRIMHAWPYLHQREKRKKVLMPLILRPRPVILAQPQYPHLCQVTHQLCSCSNTPGLLRPLGRPPRAAAHQLWRGLLCVVTTPRFGDAVSSSTVPVGLAKHRVHMPVPRPGARTGPGIPGIPDTRGYWAKLGQKL